MYWKIIKKTIQDCTYENVYKKSIAKKINLHKIKKKNHVKPKHMNPHDIFNKTIWKRQKHHDIQPCFCWNSRVISYLNCFNKRKRQRSPSTHAYSPLRGMVVSSLFYFYFFEKTKEAPNPKVKILCHEGQINIYIVA